MTPCTIRSDAQCVISGQPDGSQNIGAIVGVILDFFSVVFIIIAVFCCLRRHRRNSHSPEDDADRRNRENRPDSATSAGINSNNPSNREFPIRESEGPVINSTNDVMENVESNEVLPDSNQANSSIDSPVLRQLSTDLISADWKFFFRELSVQETDIEQVEQDHGTVKEQIFQLLLQLNQRGTLTKSNLRGALMRRGRNDLVAKYCSDC